MWIETERHVLVNTNTVMLIKDTAYGSDHAIYAELVTAHEEVLISGIKSSALAKNILDGIEVALAKSENNDILSLNNPEVKEKLNNLL